MRNISPVVEDDDIANKKHTHSFSDLVNVPIGLTNGGKEISGASSYTLAESVDYPVMALSLYGRSTQNGTPTPEAPADIVSVGDKGFDIVFKDETHFYLLSVRDKNADIITRQPASAVAKLGEEVTFSVTASGSELTYQWQYSKDNGKTWINGARGAATPAFKAAEAYSGYKYRCVITDSNGKVRISNESTLYILSEDREIKTATLTAALPFCGIPVASGGNYTDSSGQMWICDELIYNADGTGKIIKRTKALTFDGSSDEAWNSASDSRFVIPLNDNDITYPLKTSIKAAMISDRFICQTADDLFKDTSAIGLALNPSNKLLHCRADQSITTIEEFRKWLGNNTVKIVFQAAVPQIIELTAAEIAALRTLQTFNGTTEISDDAGAEMSLKYCTSKALSAYALPIFKCMQAQIDELKTAMLSLGGNV